MLIIDPHYKLILFFASTILITGCEMRTIQIHSLIFGDYLGTITVNGTFKVSEEAELIDDALENPDWNPTSNNVTIPEENTTPRLCECEDWDVECWINCLESTIRTENQRKKRSPDYYPAQGVTETNSKSPDFVNKIFSVIENSNKQQICHKK